MSKKSRLSALIVAAIALACVTINVYFPEAEVKELSERIEDAVAREAAEQAREPGVESDGESADAGDPRALTLGAAFEIALGTALHLLGPAPAYAQDEVAAPEISNPAIRRIIDSRAGRVRELNRYKAAGVVGENNKALVEVRNLDALALQERAAVQKLVRDENADRERMFKEIAAATGVDLSQLPQVQATYAETLRQKARPGDWIQQPDGTWTQKR